MSDIDEYNSDSNSDSDNDSIISEKIPVISKKLAIGETNLDEEEVTNELEDELNENDLENNDFLENDDDEIDLDDDDDEDDDDEDNPDDYDMEGGGDGDQKKQKKKLKEKVGMDKSKSKSKIIVQNNAALYNYNTDDDDEDDDEDDNYLQKFDSEINKNYVVDFHPECSIHNYDEISILTHIIRDSNNIIIDDLHKTVPFLTKYEQARVLGQRAKQINSGAKAFVKIPENVIDGYIIAELELQQKRIPFIIRRPIPGGASEYWNLRDLENIHF